jgi:heme/copper-type cytochrome/quinol oxidase subunit 2
MLIFCGALLAFVGVLLIASGRMNLPIGRLPGDIVYKGKNTTFYFPLATSIIFSIVLSLVFYVLARARR